MTVVLVALGFVLLLGLGVAYELLRWGRVSSSEVDVSVFDQELSGPESYEPMSRLFAERDFDYVERNTSLGWVWSGKIRRTRYRVLSLYMTDLRCEFMKTCSICRLLAPMSPDPEFAFSLIRRLIQFHFTYFAVKWACWLGCYAYIRVDTAKMLDTLREIAGQAQGSLRAFESARFSGHLKAGSP